MRRAAAGIGAALLAGAALAQGGGTPSAAAWLDRFDALAARVRREPGTNPFTAGWPEAAAVSGPIETVIPRVHPDDRRCASARLNINADLLASDLRATPPAERASTSLDAAVTRFVRQHFPCPAALGEAPSIARVIADLEAAGREAQAAPHLAGPFPPEAGSGPAATVVRGDLGTLASRYRTDLAADQQAGRRVGVCLPPPGKASLDSSAVEVKLRAVPPAARDAPATAVFGSVLDAQYACPGSHLAG